MRATHLQACILMAVVPIATPLFGAQAQEEAAMPAYWRVYIGTYTREASKGIYLLHLDAKTGHVEARGLAGETVNPSFLAIHPGRQALYAVGEMPKDGDHPGGTVSAFRIDADTGLLTLLNRQSSGGPGPCHVTVAPSGRHVAVANYSGGSVALLPIGEDGSLGAASAFIQHEGNSINPQRQEGPHAHSVNFDQAGRFLFAADLGLDRMLVYRYAPDSGTLAPNDPAFAALEPGAGPRHLAFHPSGRFAYVVNELGNTVTAFAYDETAGRLDTLQSIGTLPDDFEGTSHTAEIRVHPSGRFLYASNRGHDSIAAFAIDPGTGHLSALGQASSGGKTPRNFNIDPSGQFLLAANQDTGNVTVFRIDPGSGALESTGQSIDVPTPVCVAFMQP